MINGIAGKPGGGKSYEATKNHVIPAIKSGRRVVTNLPLNIDHFASVYGEHVRDLIVIVQYDFHDYGNLKPFSRIDDWLEHQDWKNEKGQGVLFAIDEAHLSLPSRMQRGTGQDITKVLEFLSMHRHYGFDVLLITQNFKKVHADIRDMIQLVYRCIKKSMFGVDDEYIIKVHEGCTSLVVNTDERAYEPYVFKFYKSHTMSEKSIEEATTVDVVPWWKHSLMFGAGFMLFIFLLVLVFLLNHIFSDEEQSDVSLTKESPVPQVLDENKQLPSAGDTSLSLPTEEQQISQSLSQNRKLPTPISEPKQFNEYKDMVEKSKSYHPFYKVELAVSGFAQDYGFKIMYFSARQNGQHIFTITNRDLALAGYDVRILTDCSVKIKYFDYVDFLTCNAPSQSVPGSKELIASN